MRTASVIKVIKICGGKHAAIDVQEVRVKCAECVECSIKCSKLLCREC